MLSRIMLAIGGLLFGVAIIAMVELVLAAFGVGDDAPLHDPFAGFSSAVHVFERVESENPGGKAIYRISPARQEAPNPLGPEPQREFLVEKPDGEYRIFVIGGSSSEGMPYSTNYAFSTWLERRLDASLPEIDVKVVNAGMSGYASRRVLPIVQEIERYQPDVLVVYMGHNEWAESMYYDHLLNMDPRLFKLLEWAYGTRIYALFSKLLDIEANSETPELDIDIGPNALQMFGVFKERASGRGYPTARELAFRDILYEHNLRSIARVMKRAGAKLVFLTLSQNFSDWPPPASSHREGLEGDALTRWDGLVASGTRLAAEHDCQGALDAFLQAMEIDDQYADLHFRTANCQRELGLNSEALRHYRLASDLDRVPHGANTRFNDVIRRVAGEEGAILVDVDAALIEESGDGLVGFDLFTDFAHPNVRAHQRIALTVSQALQEAGLPVDASEWKQGYSDPPLAEIYRDEPRLKILELQSRVFVCLLAPRETCPEETARLREMDPENYVISLITAAAER